MAEIEIGINSQYLKDMLAALPSALFVPFA